MASAQVNGITVEYETFGKATDPTLLLVNGLGSQLINWEPRFCEMLNAQGFHVVVFDNRDVGLTSKTAGDAPNMAALQASFRSGERATGTPYTLTDMADDGFALLDSLGVTQAHIMGMSMGGMIVQRMAIEHPERVLSMTSIMSTTGKPGAGKATPEAAKSLVAASPTDREGYIEHTVAERKLTAGSHFPADYWRTHQGKAYDRMFHPVGAAFQIAAVASDGDRTEGLRSLEVPSLVIHGRMDPLITLSGGEATADAIPGAELLVIDTMGHDLPEEIWPEVIAAMTKVAGLSG